MSDIHHHHEGSEGLTVGIAVLIGVVAGATGAGLMAWLIYALLK